MRLVLDEITVVLGEANLALNEINNNLAAFH
jgi:hypothetical protein